MRIAKSLPIPTLVSSKDSKQGIPGLVGFPLDHYSYSAWSQFSQNPFMFKINRINGDWIETTSSSTNVLGKAGHKALQAYLGGVEIPTPAEDGEAIKFGYEYGANYIKTYSDGFIEYNTKTPTRAKLEERFSFIYFAYIKEFNYKGEVKEIVLVEKMLKHSIQIGDKVMPVPLKGSADLVYRDFKDLLKIRDHKFVSRYSDPEAIDAAKLLQAAFNYFLVYAETGEKPYSMIYAELKVDKNADGSPQMREYEMVYEKTPLMFELFYRFYEDITDALMGKQVYVPNISAFYDKEVAILAYIHRLDVDEARAAAFKAAKVDNITDFLKQRIQKDGAMKQYLETVAQKFVSAKTMNYKDMTIPERIKMKMGEHGIALDFEGEVHGASVTLYRYEPSIGVKMTRIEAFAKDVEQVLGVTGIRVLAPIPNSTFVGFEVPREDRVFPMVPKAHGFNMPIGMTIMGEVREYDIRQAPHMLVAGASGSGKSVFLNGLIPNLRSVGELHLFDPKLVELKQFKSMACEYEHESDKICVSLANLVTEMETRYEELSKLNLRNIEGTNIPYKFVVIDEFGDLALQNPEGYEEWELCRVHGAWNKAHGGMALKLLATKRRLRVREEEIVEAITFCENCKKIVIPPFEDSLLRLAAKGRAAGIHIVIATQSPRAEIIKGSIKANFPVKVVFQTSKAIESMIVIDELGAEKLKGKGDMLFMGDKGVERLQGFNV